MSDLAGDAMRKGGRIASRLAIVDLDTVVGNSAVTANLHSAVLMTDNLDID